MNQPDKNMEEWLLDVPHNLKAEEWQNKRERVEAYITSLIEHNFAHLIELLYRLDISEYKLKTLLANSTGTNSSALITNLIIERQLQKIAARQMQEPDNNITEEDRW